MKENKALERIYELIENYDFNDLSDFERSLVLKHISEKEYRSMRLTIVDTRNLFDKLPVDSKNFQPRTMKKLLNYSVELYKFAAAIIIFIGLGC